MKLNAKSHYAVRSYAECHFAVCHSDDCYGALLAYLKVLLFLSEKIEL